MRASTCTSIPWWSRGSGRWRPPKGPIGSARISAPFPSLREPARGRNVDPTIRRRPSTRFGVRCEVHRRPRCRQEAGAKIAWRPCAQRAQAAGPEPLRRVLNGQLLSIDATDSPGSNTSVVASRFDFVRVRELKEKTVQLSSIGPVARSDLPVSGPTLGPRRLASPDRYAMIAPPLVRRLSPSVNA